MKQTIYKTISDKRSIPFNANGTGTIVTHGIAVVGTGTLFKTELQAGSYLVDLTQNECRRVYRVDSDTSAFLEKPFTSDIASSAPKIITHIQAKVKEISLDTSSACFIDGEAFTGILTLSRSGDSQSTRRDLLDPIIVDASAGSMNVSIINY